ncbi:glycosyl hydrolase 115 family protein [Neptunicella sp. SCSIO 80796]|uniref:glycosyl hydrolase 115 family protein n=1 Tax=Neptunicella plasticusilytica TaxID=3117012 RepID=UPI003A4D46DB
MKQFALKIYPVYLVAIMLAGLLAFPAYAELQESYISTDYQKGDFVVANNNDVASLYVDSQDYKGVIRAVSNLHGDIFKVTGQQGRIVTESTSAASLIIIGTLGHSQLIDKLVATGKINVSGIRDQWEAFIIQTVDNPVAGIEKALVIVGSDKRGSIFGVYDLSEKIGVSPWYWWADVAIKKHQQLFVHKDTLIQDQPKVRYRGIFLNDEAPALTGWVKEKFGDYNSQFYEHVFELLLRLKANFLWPAMWNNAFSLDDPNNSILADEMGIVMSNSHHEPMMRADKEWDRVGKGKWDYAVNKDNLYQFWQQGAQRHKNLESIFTLGMRGQADTPMSETENIGLLEEIVADQRQILKETFSDRDISEVPQVWTLYKEVQGYYEKGMRVPDDVTLLWSDDNWGNIRRLPTPEERKRSGGAGVYYHFDYVGGPRSYRWINSTQISKVWEQMNLAYQYDATRIWITNVGDLKPMEFPTDFFLRLAWDPERWPKEKLQEFGQQWAAQQFGSQYAEQIEHLLTAYTRHNARRKPELLDENTYSQLHYNEAERISAELEGLVSQAESLYRKIPQNNQNAFFQLVLHPIKANSILFELYNNVAKNRLYAQQGRASTNRYAKQARQKFTEDAELTQQYHQLEDGRWNHFMDQTHIGYTHWNNPPANTLPYVAQNQPADVADMGVAVEGSVAAWPQTGALSLDTFSPYGQSRRYIDIYNKGKRSFEYEVTASEPWIKISKSKGNVLVEQRVWISIDWQQVPQGKVTGSVLIKGTGWGGANVNISAFNPERKPQQGFIEADGYVSIMAASGRASNSHAGSGWQEIPLYGREQSAMSSFAPLDQRFTDTDNAPYLEYDVYLFNPQQLQVHTIVAPTLNFVPGRGLRFAIGFDDQPPQMIDILANSQHSDWQQAVSDGVRSVLTEHQLEQPGAHKLKIYMLDPAVVIQKIIIDTGGLQPSYLGPPPSQYLP